MIPEEFVATLPTLLTAQYTSVKAVASASVKSPRLIMPRHVFHRNSSPTLILVALAVQESSPLQPIQWPPNGWPLRLRGHVATINLYTAHAPNVRLLLNLVGQFDVVGKITDFPLTLACEN